MGAVIKALHKGACHCGAVQFEVQLPRGFQDLRRCNCSLCAKRGAIAATVPLAALRVTSGAAALNCYRFNTMTALHYFCSRCGVYTHHRRRANPAQFSFNVACLEGVQPYELSDVPVRDNANNHPCDSPAAAESQ